MLPMMNRPPGGRSKRNHKLSWNDSTSTITKGRTFKRQYPASTTIALALITGARLWHGLRTSPVTGDLHSPRTKPTTTFMASRSKPGNSNIML